MRLPCTPVPGQPGCFELTFHFSPGAIRILQELSDEMGDDPGLVLLKAIALLKVAIDAHKRGMAVGAAENREALETEFVGF